MVNRLHLEGPFPGLKPEKNESSLGFESVKRDIVINVVVVLFSWLVLFSENRSKQPQICSEEPKLYTQKCEW